VDRAFAAAATTSLRAREYVKPPQCLSSCVCTLTNSFSAQPSTACTSECVAWGPEADESSAFGGRYLGGVQTRQYRLPSSCCLLNSGIAAVQPSGDQQVRGRRVTLMPSHHQTLDVIHAWHRSGCYLRVSLGRCRFFLRRIIREHRHAESPYRARNVYKAT
jgi:hypothetical protein